MTTQPQGVSEVRANTIGFFAVIVIALVAFHVIAWGMSQQTNKINARYCADVYQGKTPDYRQAYATLCERGRLR